MVLNIKVITNSRQNRVEKINDDNFKVYVSQKPEKGKANEKVLELLAKYLDTAKNRFKIRKGEKNKNKTIEIIDPKGAL